MIAFVKRHLFEVYVAVVVTLTFLASVIEVVVKALAC